MRLRASRSRRLLVFCLGVSMTVLGALGFAHQTSSAHKPFLAVSGNGSTLYLPLLQNDYPWGLQAGSPSYLPNYINTAGCNYMGIIGQAFNSNGSPELNLYVHLEGDGLVVDGITGSEPSIGPGAYKINLGDHPVTTTDTYHIQLRNASGVPLSDIYVVPTFDDCWKNLIVVSFQERP
jgi:hypothetical protein